jgi:3-oxoacyl-[acyl-carrier protein] reductase
MHCIITGAASGLGEALARQLAHDQHRVCLVDRDEAALARCRADLGDDHLYLAADLSIDTLASATVDRVLQAWPHIDALVNCAGITGQTHRRTHEVDSADFTRVFRVNVNATFHMMKAVLPNMLERDYGRILNVASISGKDGNAGMLAYSASKAAVIGMTKAAGKEYAETGITINAVAPAVIRTPMVAALPAEQVSYMTDKIPMKRCGTLEEFVHLARYVLAPESSFTTGFTHDLSGGRAVY